MKIAEATEKATEETKKDTLIKNIRSLMKKLNITAQQAMDILEIPTNEQKNIYIVTLETACQHCFILFASRRRRRLENLFNRHKERPSKIDF